jgi:uncharacterized protein YndB with AHSA1/START domain
MTTHSGTLKILSQGDREIVMSRVFDAPRHLVFEAFTRPELLKRWLFGPDGWTLATCDVDLRVGGAYRYVWRRDASGTEMGAGGIFREIVPPERIVSTERFDNSWYSGEAVGTILLIEQGEKTAFTQTMCYESREARDAVLKSGFESGVAASYDRLDGVLASGRPR